MSRPNGLAKRLISNVRNQRLRRSLLIVAAVLKTAGGPGGHQLAHGTIAPRIIPLPSERLYEQYHS